VNRLFATIAFFTLTVNAFSQRITVSGYVKDSRSGETLIAAEVLSGRDGVVAETTAGMLSPCRQVKLRFIIIIPDITVKLSPVYFSVTPLSISDLNKVKL